jgi:hypothetical protein
MLRARGEGLPVSCDDAPVDSRDVVTGGEIGRLQRELDRLRAENARLTRLLDLRGLETAPSMSNSPCRLLRW